MDYEKLGFKCGLEIHQQLDTGKLFCKCPSEICDEEPDFTVKRYLRASAGESGEVDEAARAESKKKKYFLYQGYYDKTCLVELDEEPPSPMNEKALEATLQVSKILGSEIIDNIRVMRKTVIDGSNTTGFQRTALVATGGTINGIGIESVCLEEDAAKIVKKNPDHTIYNLSRLGIPLIEIATSPDIKTPEEAKEVASAIGMILRSTGKVKRGIGTIRQDLNISIKEGVRIELKGVQELKVIPTYAEYEVIRQKNMSEMYKELKKRKAGAEGKIYDLTSEFSETKAKIILNALKNKGAVLAIRLPGYRGYLGREVQPGRRLGTELSDYAKTQGVKGLFHSDELPAYGITEKEVRIIKEELGIKGDDAFILIADKKEVARRAMETVIKRANKLSLVKEVRQARPDGTSQYMRPMPGASRMYPETDIPPVTPNIKDIRLPELIIDKEKRLARQYKISQDLASQLAKNNYDYEDYVKRYKNINPTFIAETLIATPKELQKRYEVTFMDDEFIKAVEEVLEQLDKNTITNDSVIKILADIGKGKKIRWENFRPMDGKELEKMVDEAIKEDPKAPIGALMGAIMKKTRGKAEGRLVMQILQKKIKK